MGSPSNSVSIPPYVGVWAVVGLAVVGETVVVKGDAEVDVGLGLLRLFAEQAASVIARTISMLPANNENFLRTFYSFRNSRGRVLSNQGGRGT